MSRDMSADPFEESICRGCEADGFCGIQDDLNESQYNCPINEKWNEAQRRLNGARGVYNELLKAIDFHERASRTHGETELEKYIQNTRVKIADALREWLEETAAAEGEEASP